MTKAFAEAKVSMRDFITVTQLEWANEKVASVNHWLEIQQAEYSKLALAEGMSRACLKALELAVKGGYSLDSNNNLNIHTS